MFFEHRNKRISKLFLLALCDVRVPLLVIGGMILHIGSFHPLPHSWSHTVPVARLHPLTVCVPGRGPPRTHAPRAGSLEGKLKQSLLLLLLLQECVSPKPIQGKEEEPPFGGPFKSGCPSLPGAVRLEVWRSRRPPPPHSAPEWLTHGSSSLASFMFPCTC